MALKRRGAPDAILPQSVSIFEDLKAFFEVAPFDSILSWKQRLSHAKQIYPDLY